MFHFMYTQFNIFLPVLTRLLVRPLITAEYNSELAVGSALLTHWVVLVVTLPIVYCGFFRLNKPKRIFNEFPFI